MIGFVKGVIEDIEEESVIVEQGGIGFRIFVPASAINGHISIGANVKLFTYMSVREDDISLYGFTTKEELRIFKMLIGVNGIGPKAALGVLSVLTPDELMFAVLSDDIKYISKAPGIGKKTAQKLILELKDKFELQDAFEQKAARVNKEKEDASTLKGDSAIDLAFQRAKQEAVEALAALGYSNTEALKAVNNAKVDSSADVETILKASLKKLF